MPDTTAQPALQSPVTENKTPENQAAETAALPPEKVYPEGERRTENGFTFALFPAKTAKPEKLVIFLHGLGADIDGMGYGAEKLQEVMPEADFIALRAPRKMPAAPDGRQGYSWFKMEGMMDMLKAYLRHFLYRLPGIGDVQKFARAQLKKRGLESSDLAYIGQSMGGIIALQAALTDKQAPAVVISHGSSVVPFTRVKSKPQVVLFVGEKDNIFNHPEPPPPTTRLARFFNAIARKISLSHTQSMARLEKAGVPHLGVVLPGEGHQMTWPSWNTGNIVMAGYLRKTPKP